MKTIGIERIDNEMILADDVCGQSGNVLLGKGTKLTKAIGRRLKNWGISSVDIEGTEDTIEENPKEEQSDEVFQNHLIAKFKDVIQNPIMKILYNAVKAHKGSKHH